MGHNGGQYYDPSRSSLGVASPETQVVERLVFQVRYLNAGLWFLAGIGLFIVGAIVAFNPSQSSCTAEFAGTLCTFTPGNEAGLLVFSFIGIILIGIGAYFSNRVWNEESKARRASEPRPPPLPTLPPRPSSGNLDAAQVPPPLCSVCSGALTWVAQVSRWYCPHCGQAR